MDSNVAASADTNAQSDVEEYDEPTYFAFESPDMAAGFCKRLAAALAAGTFDGQEEFEFEGADVAEIVELHLLMLAFYDPEYDPHAKAQPADELEPGSDADLTRKWMQNAKANLHESYGTPLTKQLVVVGPEDTPVSTVDALMLSAKVSEAELWQIGDQRLVLLAGWLGEPGLSRLQQMAFFLNDEPEEEDGIPFIFSAGAADPVRIVATSEQDAYMQLAEYVDMHGSDVEYTIDHNESANRLKFSPSSLLLTRIDHHDLSRTQTLKVERAAQCLTAAKIFFGDGYDGLDNFGAWVSESASS